MPTDSKSEVHPASPAKPRSGRGVTAYLRFGFLGGLTILVMGQVFAIAGILMPALFLPGVYVIELGLLVLTVSGVAAAFLDSDADAPPPPSRPRARGGE